MITHQQTIDVIQETAKLGSGNPDIDFDTVLVCIPTKLMILLAFFGEAAELSLGQATWDNESKTVELHLQ